MRCPRCGSCDLWDDMLAFGCNSCGYANIDGNSTFALARDKPGLARSVDEMRARGQLPAKTGMVGMLFIPPGKE